MPAPLAKGLIIAASVLVAAGIAIYESPQVRQWVDQSRRKIAIALHTLGDEVQPRRNSDSSEDSELRKKRASADLLRRRSELIRKAREEGIAVDLDELARIGRDDVEMTEQKTPRPRTTTRSSSQSFDDLVGSDGKLKKEDPITQSSTALDSDKTGLRRRGFYAGAAAANPFGDEALLDLNRELDAPDDDDEAPSPRPFHYIESRDSSVTVDGEPAPSQTAQLVDIIPDTQTQPEHSQTASIHSLDTDALEERLIWSAQQDQASQSSYSLGTNNSSRNDVAASIIADHDSDSEPENISTGTLTPRSEGFSAAVSIGSQGDDIAVLSMQSDDDHDARSEAFSEGGFSVIGEDESVGAMTPSSWTDVGSDDESEFGGNGLQGTQQWGQSTIKQH